jgi:hypothetical protein
MWKQRIKNCLPIGLSGRIVERFFELAHIDSVHNTRIAQNLPREFIEVAPAIEIFLCGNKNCLSPSGKLAVAQDVINHL